MVKKRRLYFWSRFDAKYLFRVFFKISEQLSNYSSISIWIAFIPGGQYSCEATMCSERAFVMRTSSLPQFLVALWTPKILCKPGEI